MNYVFSVNLFGLSCYIRGLGYPRWVGNQMTYAVTEYYSSTMGGDTSSNVLTWSGMWLGTWSEVCGDCAIDGSIATILHYQ